MASGGMHLCSACGEAAERFGPGPNGRPNVSCPGCGGLERHRFLMLLLEVLAPRALTTGRALLDIAPSTTTTPRLRELADGHYISVDFDPAADRRVVDVAASLTALPLAAGSVDLMICYHVLEHVPDDATAMAEIARVLRPGAVAAVQVPWNPGHPTDEDPSAPVEERVRRFGQADHVRFYGDDLEARLEKAGLDVDRIRTGDVVPPSWVELFRFNPDEVLWLVRPQGSEPVVAVADLPAELAATVPIVFRRALGATSARYERSLAQAEQKAENHRTRADRWRDDYRALRSQAPVRAVLRAEKLSRRVTDRLRAARPR